VALLVATITRPISEAVTPASANARAAAAAPIMDTDSLGEACRRVTIRMRRPIHSGVRLTCRVISSLVTTRSGRYAPIRVILAPETVLPELRLPPNPAIDGSPSRWYPPGPLGALTPPVHGRRGARRNITAKYDLRQINDNVSLIWQEFAKICKLLRSSIIGGSS
jgi:hypothetical protein